MMNSPVVLPNSNTANGSKFIGFHRFDDGTKAPIYDIQSTGAFNQLVGYAKFLNHKYGKVYCRGVDKLYPNVLPSILRGRVRGDVLDLHTVLAECENHPYLSQTLQLFEIPHKTKDNSSEVNRLKQVNKSIIEGMIQHYAGNTRFVDVVDNHWVALWMGLQQFINCGEGGKYIKCQQRGIAQELLAEHIDELLAEDAEFLATVKSNLYEYILLLAMPTMDKESMRGVSMNNEMIEVDLRQALPSFFLRPHAQHALVVRKRQPQGQENLAAYYDMESQIVGILRVRLDLAVNWLGTGELVSEKNFFPSPSIDLGYNSLLKNDIFESTKCRNFSIKRYY